ncbi:MAG: DNA-3-methyladenine glycosylase [SAR324 cluster bacterium]|nr:DNA-3-methyladenine glycosylase [SAR324 cluster bacterium]
MDKLSFSFFDRDALLVAKELLGKIIRHCCQGIWLSAMIIETEAYYKKEKGSHASLGFTEKRKALFMEPGTIYMYYARGGDSLNFSCQGEGNAVLIKSCLVYCDEHTSSEMLPLMQKLNPQKNMNRPRPIHYLCSGQTLLCKSLGLKVTDWDQKYFDPERFFLEDIGYRPEKIIQTTRLGIPQGRDEHLMYRFIDYDKAAYCTSNPLRKKKWTEGKDYHIFILSQKGTI